MQDDDGNWKIPNEVLIHIVNLIDERENLRMSCRKFYSIICDIEKPKVLKINSIDKVRMCNKVSSHKINYFLMTHFSWRTKKFSCQSLIHKEKFARFSLIQQR